MPKSKESPALLEVYRRGEVKQSAPKAAQAPADSQTPPASVEENSAPTPTPRAPQTWVEPQGDHIRFSLSTLSLAMVLFVALVAIAGAFALGKYFGYQGGRQVATERAEMVTSDPLREIREQPPSPGVLEDLDLVTETVRAEQARERRRGYTARVDFVDNLNYIWIERFNSRADATSAQAYLSGNRIESALVERNGKWLLISKEGFDYRLPEEKSACRKLSERIKLLGLRYFESGGRYRFDCFAKKKLPGQSW